MNIHGLCGSVCRANGADISVHALEVIGFYLKEDKTAIKFNYNGSEYLIVADSISLNGFPEINSTFNPVPCENEDCNELVPHPWLVKGQNEVLEEHENETYFKYIYMIKVSLIISSKNE